ncbi:MAG: uroporphyrin-III C-methyltransferase/precorrin-2 dehydrogenase/sirohydrochlorin ferrochelatase, partial [Oceanicoccus sp.]
VPAAYGQLASLVSGFRDRVKSRFASIDERRFFWEGILQGPASEMVFAGNHSAAKKLISDELLKDDVAGPIGEVYLVGAGPGDPDLLTFKALRLMQKADVVLFDRLVSDEIIELTRRDADRIYVGKARSKHAVAQSDINSLLVTLAKEGRRVLRLKGGDPFIFGRGGEEIEELAQHGIPFQVVPGITAASGCAAYAGIPLTHRDHAQSVRFVTGHLKDGSIDLPWSDLTNKQQTLVFYMGLVGLPVICSQLIKHGCDAKTPIALIQQGTTLKQRVYVGTLDTMAEKIAALDIKPPTLLIIGAVVRLREKLSWLKETDGVDGE